MNTHIRQATPLDTESIRHIAGVTYWAAYGSILSEEQICYMLQTIYHPENIHFQIETGVQQYLLLLEEDRPVGFVAYAPRQENPAVYKLHKLYCLPEAQGRGYGKMLIEAVSSKVREAGQHTLELNVNRYNKALQFYERMGFSIAYEEDIPIGDYWMNDYVMRMELGY